MVWTYADIAQEFRQSSIAGMFKGGYESSNRKEQCHDHDDNVCLIYEIKLKHTVNTAELNISAHKAVSTWHQNRLVQ